MADARLIPDQYKKTNMPYRADVFLDSTLGGKHQLSGPLTSKQIGHKKASRAKSPAKPKKRKSKSKGLF